MLGACVVSRSRFAHRPWFSRSGFAHRPWFSRSGFAHRPWFSRSGFAHRSYRNRNRHQSDPRRAARAAPIPRTTIPQPLSLLPFAPYFRPSVGVLLIRLAENKKGFAAFFLYTSLNCHSQASSREPLPLPAPVLSPVPSIGPFTLLIQSPNPQPFPPATKLAVLFAPLGLFLPPSNANLIQTIFEGIGVFIGHTPCG